MRLEHLLSGVCVLQAEAHAEAATKEKGNGRSVSFLVYSVSEDGYMMIKEKS